MIFLRQLPVVLVIVFVLSPIAAGMEAQAGTVSATPSEPWTVIAATSGPGLEAWIQLLGMLLLLLGIFAAAAWAIKRWRLLPQLREGGQNLKIVESRSLGQRNSILVVQYMDREFLIGSGSNGVQLIGELGGDSSPLGQAVPSDPAVSVDEGAESEKLPGFLSSLSQHIQKEGK